MSRAVFTWKRRPRPDDLEASLGSERLLDWERRSHAVQTAAREREKQILGQEHAVEGLEALLFRHDPIGINDEENLDEYRPEAQTITLRRRQARSMEDVQRIVHEEFVKWFGGATAGPPERYRSIAEEIWAGWSLTDNPDRVLGD